jgi:ABC-2 type transport system ATP-binding protein
MSTAAIDVASVTKSYNRGKVRALDGVSLSIQAGEVFGLIGPNGAGKSTFMGLLLGLLMPTAGSITVFGRSAYDLSIRQVTGYLPERPYFDAWMTPVQFLRYHHMLVKRPDHEADAAVKSALEKVQLDPEVWHRQIKKLSRGTLQRLGLAQVLIGKPMICFLDEPDSGMDPLGTALVRSLIGEWKQLGCTVLLNSHHLDEVEKTCDRVAFIKKGKIVAVRELAADALTAENFMRFRWETSNGTAEPRQSPEQEAARKVLQTFGTKYGAELQEVTDNQALVTLPEKRTSTAMIKDMLAAGINLQEAVIERQSLEDLFVKIQQEETA